MRQDIDIQVGVDVGSHAVRAVVVRPARGAVVGEDGLLGPIEVLGAGVAESRGVALGEVVEARAASRAIREAVEEAERASGANVRWAVLGASGGMVKARGVDAEVALRAGRVEPWDPERARSALRTASRTHGMQRLLEQIASFRVAQAAGEPVEAADPVGLQGARLLASAVVLEASAIPLAALAAAGRRAGVETRALGWSPLAAALAVLGEREREDGVALLDLGAGSAGLVLLAGGRLLFASGRRSGEDGDGLWRWLRESLGGFLGLPRDLLPAGLVLSGGGGLRPDVLSRARAELGLEARAAALGPVTGLSGPAAEWAAAVGLARLLEATDALRRRTDRTRVPAPLSLHRPVAARLAELPGGAEEVLPRVPPESELMETGIDCLDQFPGRPARGQLCLLASQPFSGASGMALQIALHSALHRLEPTLLVTGTQSFKRTVLELAGIEAKMHPSEVLRTGKGRRSKAERLAAALTRIVDTPLWVLDAEEDGVDDPESLVGAARAIQASLGLEGGEGLGLRLVVVDPLSALGPRAGWCGYRLRALARELDAVVLVLATTESLRERTPLDDDPRPPRLEDLNLLGDLADTADLLWLAHRPGLFGDEDGDHLELRVASRHFGMSGCIMLDFDGQRVTGPARAEPRRRADAAQAEHARLLYDACDPYADCMGDLLARHQDGVGEEELLADPALDDPDGDDWLRDGIRDALKGRYGGFLVGRVMVVRREGRLVPVDLGRLDTLFGPSAEEAARALFGLAAGAAPLRENGFDWVALVRLLARSVRRAMSWGDGHLSNGAWLVAAPRPAGVLGLLFDLGSGRVAGEPAGDPARRLRTEGYAEASIEVGEKSARVLPCMASLDPVLLAGVLAVLGGAPGGVRVLCRGPADPVLFELGGVVRAALMPVRG